MNNVAPSGAGLANTCHLSGGALQVWLERHVVHGANEYASWIWASPTGLRPVGASLHFFAQGYNEMGDAAASVTSLRTVASGPIWECVADFGCPSWGVPGRWGPTLDVSAGNFSDAAGDQLYFLVSCGTSHPSAGCLPVPGWQPETAYPAKVRMDMYGGHWLLSDESSPTASNVAGSLASSVYMRDGSLAVGGSLADVGSGVRRLHIQREDSGTWTTLATSDIAGNRSTCSSIDNAGGMPSYSDVVPCSASIYGSISVATSTVPEGRSPFRVLVEDASGNSTTIMGPAERVVDRTPPTVSYATTPGSCMEGEMVSVLPTATDAVAGIDTIVVSVLDNDGIALGVTATGTIDCPAAARGPLTVTTTAIDKAGNEAVVSRPAPISVVAKPEPPKEDPPDKTPVGGGGRDNGGGGQSPPQVLPPQVLPPQVDPGPVIDQRIEGARRLLACSSRDVMLTEAVPSGRRDIVSGVASPDLVGHTVSILYGTQRRTVARMPVAADGTFRVVVAAPKKGGSTNSARYTARVSNHVSSALKRQRRMYATQAYKAVGSSIWAAGRLTRPFRTGTRVRIQQRGAQCSAWKTIATTKVDSAGRYGVTVPVASSDASLVVRAVSEVQTAGKTAKKKRRTFKTWTLPGLVAMR